VIGTLDDLYVHLRHYFRHGAAKQRALIAAIGVEFHQERIHAEHGRHDECAAVPILNVSGMNDGMNQQALRIDENMPLLALDLLSRVVARRINRSPPYMGRLKSSANFMVLPFFVPFVLAIGGDRPTPIDPHESGGGGRSLDLKTTKRHEAEPALS
jgi:hypothetical protein